MSHATPFEQFRDFARRIIAVPKKEADAVEKKWRKKREKKAQAKAAQKPWTGSAPRAFLRPQQPRAVEQRDGVGEGKT